MEIWSGFPMYFMSFWIWERKMEQVKSLNTVRERERLSRWKLNIFCIRESKIERAKHVLIFITYSDLHNAGVLEGDNYHETTQTCQCFVVPWSCDNATASSHCHSVYAPRLIISHPTQVIPFFLLHLLMVPASSHHLSLNWKHVISYFVSSSESELTIRQISLRLKLPLLR